MGDRDTLTSLSAKFDTTPSEVSKLNRLGSTFVYPGQKLWVPTKGEARPGSQASNVDAPSPDPSHDHDSQDDLPPEEKGMFRTFFPTFFTLLDNFFLPPNKSILQTLLKILIPKRQYKYRNYIFKLDIC